MKSNDHPTEWSTYLLWAVIAATAVAVSVQQCRERISKPAAKKAQKELEDILRATIMGKAKVELKKRDFSCDYTDSYNQETYINRYYKLVFDVLTEQQIVSGDFPTNRDAVIRVGNWVMAKENLKLKHGREHDYLLMGNPLSDEAEDDIKNFEGFVESACKYLRYRFANKKVPSKKLIAAIREYMSMHSISFYGLEKEHSAIRQKIVAGTIYQRIRKELEIPKPVPKNTSPLARSEYVYCNRTIKNWHILSVPLKRIMTPYTIGHKG